MKPIVEIARAELKRLFFSPVSWLVLIIFAFQMTLIFNECMDYLVDSKGMKQATPYITHSFFASDINMAFFLKVQEHLYFYIPLLTMSILSRDLSSGAIKLLYSSPVSNRQIILGKYLALVIFGVIMLLVVGLESFYAVTTFDNVDWPVMISGLAGLFLLLCCYAAVGLFMSSLTSYAIVAAITTFAVLAIFNLIGRVGQEIPIVRDITFWFTLGGRSILLIWGLISSEGLLYFIAFIGLLLSLTIIKLDAGRNKQARLLVAGRYVLVLAVVSLIGYVSSRPTLKWYWDVTRTKSNTLSKESQAVVKKLTGGLTVKTYSNMLDMQTATASLPGSYKNDVARYDLYTRFKPEIGFEYTWYYQPVPNEFYQYYEKRYPGLVPSQIMDSIRKNVKWKFPIVPYERIKQEVDLSGEGFRHVSLLQRENGRQAFLRVFDGGNFFPGEAHITAALKRMAEEPPVIGCLTGHGERSITNKNERGYETFTQRKTNPDALVNHGFDFMQVDLNAPVPNAIGILLIADCKTPFSDQEMEHFRQYIARGGNCLIAAEPGRQTSMNPITTLFGVRIGQGTLIQPKKMTVPERVLSSPTAQADSFSHHLKGYHDLPSVELAMITAAPLAYELHKGFAVQELFRTDSSGTWNELETTNFREDSALYHPAAGESRQPYVTALALSRMVNNKKQQIVITGDADWLSNGEIMKVGNDFASINHLFFHSLFYELSDRRFPIDTRRDLPIDNTLSVEKNTWTIIASFLKWGIPVLLFLTSLVILVRRKGR